jgi:hypothetical protein
MLNGYIIHTFKLSSISFQSIFLICRKYELLLQPLLLVSALFLATLPVRNANRGQQFASGFTDPSKGYRKSVDSTAGGCNKRTAEYPYPGGDVHGGD